MKVTFLELYNEEITDLLALEDQSRFPEDRQKRAISLMEDRKGGAVIRGLEEVVVYSASEIYNLLEHGSARRRTADTALNKQSRYMICSLPFFLTVPIGLSIGYWQCAPLDLQPITFCLFYIHPCQRNNSRESGTPEVREIEPCRLGRIREYCSVRCKRGIRFCCWLICDSD